MIIGLVDYKSIDYESHIVEIIGKSGHCGSVIIESYKAASLEPPGFSPEVLDFSLIALDFSQKLPYSSLKVLDFSP
jgi:hypothetical protein